MEVVETEKQRGMETMMQGGMGAGRHGCRKAWEQEGMGAGGQESSIIPFVHCFGPWATCGGTSGICILIFSLLFS